MANKVEIVYTADGSRAIRVHQDLAASARARGQAERDAARVTAAAARLQGEAVSAASVLAIEARRKEQAASADYMRIQSAVRKGSLDEATGVTLLAGAYQRLTRAKREAAVASKAAGAGSEGRTWASLRENFGALRIGEMIPETLGAAAGIAVMAEAASKLKEAVSDTLEFAEAIQRASEKTGLSAETLSVLHYAAQTTGGDFDSMTAAVAKMDRTVAQATEGNKKAIAFLHSLGLNAKDLANSPDGAEQAFRKFAVTLAETENPIRRVELATGLLGKAGAEQIPTIIRLGENWEKLAQGAENAGVMLNGQTLKGLIATKEQIEQMHQTVLGVKVGLTEGLIQPLDQMLSIIAGGKTPMESLNEIGKDIGKTFAFVASVMVEFAAAVNYVSGTVNALIPGLGDLAQHELDEGSKLEDKAARLTGIWTGRTPSGGHAPGDLIGASDRFATKQHSLPKNGGDGFGGIGDISGNPDEKRFKAMRDALEQQKLLHQASLSDEKDYWERMLAATSKKKDPGLYALITPEVVRSQHALFEELFGEWKQQAEEAKSESERLHETLEKTWDELNKQDSEKTKAAYAAVTAMLTGAGDKRYQDLLGGDQVREFQLRLAPSGEAARATAADHTAEYGTRLGNLQDQVTRASGAPGDTPEEIAARVRNVEEIQREIAELGRQRQLQMAEDDARVASTTLLGGAADALREFAREATDGGAQIKAVLTNGLNGVNEGIVKYLTEPHSETQGKHIFGKVGHDVATNIAGSALKYGEGKILNGLGFGGGADGKSEASALWVRLSSHGGDDGTPGSGGWLGKLLHLGQPDSNSVTQGHPGAFASLVIKLLNGISGGARASSGSSDDSGDGGGDGTLFGGGGNELDGFADGTDFAPGGMAIVGERGPELVNLPRGSSVIPNHAAFSGGGHTFNGGDLHVHGSGGTGISHAELQAAFAAHTQKMRKDIAEGMSQARLRMPPGMRR